MAIGVRFPRSVLLMTARLAVILLAFGMAEGLALYLQAVSTGGRTPSWPVMVLQVCGWLSFVPVLPWVWLGGQLVNPLPLRVRSLVFHLAVAVLFEALANLVFLLPASLLIPAQVARSGGALPFVWRMLQLRTVSDLSLYAGLLVVWQVHARRDAESLARAARVRARHEAFEAKRRELMSRLQPTLLGEVLVRSRELVWAEPGRAERLIAQLSRFLRSLLQTMRQPVHSLGRELRVAHEMLLVYETAARGTLRARVSVPQTLIHLPVPAGRLLNALESALPPTSELLHATTPGEVTISLDAPGGADDGSDRRSQGRSGNADGSSLTLRLEYRAGAHLVTRRLVVPIQTEPLVFT